MIFKKKVTKEDLTYTPVPVFDCIYCLRDIQAQQKAFKKTSDDSIQALNKKMIRWQQKEKERERQ